jgi:predicted GTPase
METLQTQTQMRRMISRLSSKFTTTPSVYSFNCVSSDVESLRKGIIKTSSKANAPYTILLVGETGVGKSSVLELFARVLAGKDIDHCDFDTLDSTPSTRVYEFKSNNGIAVSASV